MAVRIRLKRMGRKKRPFYRIVIVDSRKKRDGKYIEKVGHYNPIEHPAEVVIDHEKALEWLDKGAQPSDTVKSLFSKQGILHKHEMQKRGLSSEQVEEEMKKWQLLQDERVKRQEALAQQNEREQKKQKAEKASEPPAEEVKEETEETGTEEA